MNLAYTMFNKFWKNKFIITVLKSNDINDLIRCLNRLNIYNKVMMVNIDLEKLQEHIREKEATDDFFIQPMDPRHKGHRFFVRIKVSAKTAIALTEYGKQFNYIENKKT